MNNHKCDVCGRGFGTAGNLRRHEKSHHAKKEVKSEMKMEQPTTPTQHNMMGMVLKREQQNQPIPMTAPNNTNMMQRMMMSVKQEDTRTVERPWEYR